MFCYSADTGQVGIDRFYCWCLVSAGCGISVGYLGEGC